MLFRELSTFMDTKRNVQSYNCTNALTELDDDDFVKRMF